MSSVGAINRDWQVIGGTITTPTINGVAYRVHALTVSGSLVVMGPKGVLSAIDLAEMELPAEFLLIGGGGGGGGGNGGAAGGGGGAGGRRRGSIGLLPGTTYAGVVGLGGAAGPASTNGSPGGDTTMFGLTASGGGYGGFAIASSSGGSAGGPGGNGGGGGGTLGGSANAGGAATPVTTPPQGVAGQAADPTTGHGGYGGDLAFSGGYPPQTAAALFGFAEDFTGSIVKMAAGGIYGVQSAAPANTGFGGAGGVSGGAGLAGASGIILVRYRI